MKRHPCHYHGVPFLAQYIYAALQKQKEPHTFFQILVPVIACPAPSLRTLKKVASMYLLEERNTERDMNITTPHQRGHIDIKKITHMKLGEALPWSLDVEKKKNP